MKTLRPLELLLAVAISGAVIVAPTNGAVLMGLVLIQAMSLLVRSPLALFAVALMVPVVPYPIFGVPALAWAVAGGWFAVACRRAVERLQIPFGLHQQVALALALGVLVSAALHGLTGGAGWWIVLELTVLPLGFALMVEMWDRDRPHVGVSWLACGLAVAAVQSLRDMLTERSANLDEFLQTRHLYALAGGSNYVAALLTMCGLFFIALAAARGRSVWPLLGLGAACLLAPFIMASRASFIGLLTGALVLVFQRRSAFGRNRRRWLGAFLTLLLLLGIFSQTGEFLRSRLSHVAQVGLAERGPLFRASADVFQDNVVAGVGPGNIRDQLAERELFFESHYSHNVVLSLLAQLGLLLGGVYLWMLWPFRSWVLRHEVFAPMLVAGFVISLGEVGIETLRMGFLFCLALSGAAAAVEVRQVQQLKGISAGV